MVNFAYQNTEKYKLGAGLACHVLTHPEFVNIWTPVALWGAPFDEQQGFLETMDANASDELLERVVAYVEAASQFEMRTLEGKAHYVTSIKAHFSKCIGSINIESA